MRYQVVGDQALEEYNAKISDVRRTSSRTAVFREHQPPGIRITSVVYGASLARCWLNRPIEPEDLPDVQRA